MCLIQDQYSICPQSLVISYQMSSVISLHRLAHFQIAYHRRYKFWGHTRTLCRFRQSNTFFYNAHAKQFSYEVLCILREANPDLKNPYQQITHTPRPCFAPICFMPLGPFKFTSLLNLHRLIFSLMNFGWFICIYLSRISNGNIIFLISTPVIYAHYFRNTTMA